MCNEDEISTGYSPTACRSLSIRPPPGDQWLHEIKLDGYRLLCRRDGNCVSFFTRRGHCWTPKFPAIGKEVERLRAERLWLDGELVVMTEEGRSCFGSLQRAVADRDQARLAYYVFDLLYLDRRSLCEEPLELRKAALAGLIAEGAWNLQYLDHVQGSGPQFFTLACEQHLEGVVSKRAGSTYRPGKRTQNWLKSKSGSYPRNVAWRWWEEKETIRSNYPPAL